jgi:glutamate-1-semialdehyde 2,1-aminomutase
VYFAPSQFEAGFLSISHTPEVIDATLAAMPAAFSAVAGS